jgi:hypothetical protein
MCTSFELSKDNSSEILEVQNFTVQKLCAKVAAFNGCRIGYFRHRELKVCWKANYIPFSLLYLVGLF